MTGKEKCDFLKSIRVNIALANGLDYKPTECEHKTCLTGFCEPCDRETASLFKQLKEKEASGTPIQIDTHSIQQLELLAFEPTEEEDDDHVLMGLPTPLEGDITPKM